MESCPACGSKQLLKGRLKVDEWSNLETMGAAVHVQFVPGKTRIFKAVWRTGVLVDSDSVCCLSCGTILTRLDAAELKKHIEERCVDEVKERLAHALAKDEKKDKK